MGWILDERTALRAYRRKTKEYSYEQQAMRNERWKSIRHARPDQVSLDFSGDEVVTIPLSSIVFVYSPSAHIPNAGLGHGCASTPANARPPPLSSLVCSPKGVLSSKNAACSCRFRRGSLGAWRHTTCLAGVFSQGRSAKVQMPPPPLSCRRSLSP